MNPVAFRCDNYDTCGSHIVEYETYEQTVAIARAKGWHIFHGKSMTGLVLNIKLCKACVGSPRSRIRLSDAERHKNDQPLF